MAGAMRQLEVRQLPAEVRMMQWSPKMDLLAISNVKGLSLITDTFPSKHQLTVTLIQYHC